MKEMTEKTVNKFKRMDFFVNQAIINEIVGLTVENGKIDYRFVKILKEVYIVGEYVDADKLIRDEDKSIEVVDSFKKIREEDIYMEFVHTFNRKDLLEFEELLEKELSQEAELQRNEKSAVSVLEDFLYSLLAKLPSEKEIKKIIKSLPKAFEGIDEDKMKNINEFIKVLDKK